MAARVAPDEIAVHAPSPRRKVVLSAVPVVASLERAMDPASMVLVTVPVSPVVMRVPEVLGMIAVVSEDAAAVLSVISKSSALLPSKISPALAPQMARAD